MSKLHIGTCSWKYESWRGLIYSFKKPINYLEEYSKHYITVEIDQWFWSLFGVNKVSLPSPFTVQEYLESVPPDFKFTIKIPNSITLTHFYRKSKSEPLIINPHFLSVDLFKNFIASIESLKPHIGALMFQFEYLNKQKMISQMEFQEKFAKFFHKIDQGFQYASKNYSDLLQKWEYRYPRLYRRGTFKTQALLVLFLPFLVTLRIFESLLRLSLP